MHWLTQRQTVLSENVANADTPDFVPRDMKKGAFAGMVRSSSVRRVEAAATHVNHLGGHLGGADANGRPSFKSDAQKRTYETAPSGNAVVLEEQLIKVSETQMDYQTMSNLYRKHLGMIRAALGHGN